MNPWNTLWAPLFEFPFSGNVVQEIAPETDWFSANIDPTTGDAELEREIFQTVASYGKQIGILNEVLLAFVEEVKPDALKELKAMQELKELQKKIDKIKKRKAKDQEHLRANVKQVLDKFSKNDPEGFKKLLKSYRE